jgi:integrase/recombinase XerC
MTILFIKNLIDSFMESLVTEKGFSDNTIRAYHQDLEEFVHFFSQTSASGNKKKEDEDPLLIARIDRLVIREYLGFLHKKKNKKTSIARKLSALRSFFNFLVKRGVVSNNPADSVITPKTEKQFRYIFLLMICSGFLILLIQTHCLE